VGVGRWQAGSAALGCGSPRQSPTRIAGAASVGAQEARRKTAIFSRRYVEYSQRQAQSETAARHARSARCVAGSAAVE